MRNLIIYLNDEFENKYHVSPEERWLEFHELTLDTMDTDEKLEKDFYDSLESDDWLDKMPAGPFDNVILIYMIL